MEKRWKDLNLEERREYNRNYYWNNPKYRKRNKERNKKNSKEKYYSKFRDDPCYKKKRRKYSENGTKTIKKDRIKTY